MKCQVPLDKWPLTSAQSNVQHINSYTHSTSCLLVSWSVRPSGKTLQIEIDLKLKEDRAYNEHCQRKNIYSVKNVSICHSAYVFFMTQSNIVCFGFFLSFIVFFHLMALLAMRWSRLGSFMRNFFQALSEDFLLSFASTWKSENRNKKSARTSSRHCPGIFCLNLVGKKQSWSPPPPIQRYLPSKPSLPPLSSLSNNTKLRLF